MHFRRTTVIQRTHRSCKKSVALSKFKIQSSKRSGKSNPGVLMNKRVKNAKFQFETLMGSARGKLLLATIGPIVVSPNFFSVSIMYVVVQCRAAKICDSVNIYTRTSDKMRDMTPSHPPPPVLLALRCGVRASIINPDVLLSA